MQEAALHLQEHIPWYFKSIAPDLRAKTDAGDELRFAKATGEPESVPSHDAKTGVTVVGAGTLEEHVRRLAKKEASKLRRSGTTPQFSPADLASRAGQLKPGERAYLPEIGREILWEQRKSDVQVVLGGALDVRFPARIAYLFAVLTRIDINDEAFQPWRDYVRGLTARDVTEGILIDEREPTAPYSAGHLVQAEYQEKWGTLAVGVRLFGRWTVSCYFRPREIPKYRYLAYGIDLVLPCARLFLTREDFAHDGGIPMAVPDPRRGWE